MRTKAEAIAYALAHPDETIDAVDEENCGLCAAAFCAHRTAYRRPDVKIKSLEALPEIPECYAVDEEGHGARIH